QTHALIVLGGYVGVDEYRYVYFVLLLILYVLILCSNCTIICVVWIHRNLHEPMYVFIAALSLNSLLFSTSLYPKLFADVLSHEQSVTRVSCLLQFLFFYTFGGSDFLLLSAMAYDRYVSICRPLHYAATMGTSRVAVFLALAWLFPALHLSVAAVAHSRVKLCDFTVGDFFCNNTIVKLYCVVPRFLNVWRLVILTNITLIPVLFILFTYVKILSVAYFSRGEVRKKAAETCLPHLMVLISFSCLCGFHVIAAQLDSDLPKIVRLAINLQIAAYNPLLNPIIYGVKMKEIWKHVKRLLACRGKRFKSFA
ncbi:olfactory receptor 6N2-like, partial [Syngnathoides biaculeatus]|uniref:olfactory receptor 6N2-like n=1 Tax=Syngnathoides biaculeatus TaxID=300417 RepID=UPI002ADD7C83